MIDSPQTKLMFPLGVALLVLLHAGVPAAHGQTIGYWRFEGTGPTFLQDSGPNSLNLTVSGTSPTGQSTASTSFSNPVPNNGLANLQAANFGNAQAGHFFRADAPVFTVNDFTIEAYARLTTDDSLILYMASQWDSGGNQRSWGFGVGEGTGTRQQGELVLVLSDLATDTVVVESNLATLMQLNKDYYVAASFDESDLASGVKFYIQNLTDGGPLVTSTVGHTIASLHNSTANFNLGTFDAAPTRRWRGSLDEVRLSSGVLAQNDLLISQAAAVPEPSSLVLLSIVAAVALAAGCRLRRKAGVSA